MKNKKLATTMLAGVMAFTAIGVGPAFAATGTKTATLNNAQVRFNNGKVQTIQCYNIDGYNFVRARDVTNNLGMAVTAIQNGDTGIFVNPHITPTSKATPEKLAQQTAKVKVETGHLIYDALAVDAECFLLNGRYYFKLADFEKAAEHQLNAAFDLVEIEAKGDIAKAPFRSEYPSITVTWNSDTKVIDVNKTTTDLQQIFDDIRGSKTPVAKPDKEKVADKDEEKEPVVEKEDKFEATGVLTSAPKVGTVLANILIDEDEGAYLDNGKVNWDNIEKPYTYYSEKNFGQCTWYAEGRFFETHDIDRSKNRFSNTSDYDKLISNAQSDSCPDLDGSTDADDIETGCIAVFRGHLLFVEWVDFNDEGDPEKVYFTEANTQHDGKYYQNKDGKVQAMDFDNFIGRQPFIGYVVVK